MNAHQIFVLFVENVQILQRALLARDATTLEPGAFDDGFIGELTITAFALHSGISKNEPEPTAWCSARIAGDIIHHVVDDIIFSKEYGDVGRICCCLFAHTVG